MNFPSVRWKEFEGEYLFLQTTKQELSMVFLGIFGFAVLLLPYRSLYAAKATDPKTGQNFEGSGFSAQEAEKKALVGLKRILENQKPKLVATEARATA